MKTLVAMLTVGVVVFCGGLEVSAQKWVRYPSISGATFQEIAVSVLDNQIIVARIQGSAYPFYTTNGGTTWQQFPTLPDVYGSAVSWMTIVPGTQQTVRVIFDKYIAETSDFGVSWNTVSTLPSSNFRKMLVHPTRANMWFVWGASPPVLRSTNAGQDWDTVFASKQLGISGVLVSAAAPSRMYLEVRDTLFESADTGKTWQRFAHTGVLGYSIDLLAADGVTADRLYAYFQGRIAVSTDRGRTWSDRTMKNVMTVTGVLQAQSNSNVLFAWGTNLHRSTDQGMSWTTIDTMHTARLSATLVGGQLYVGCYQSGIFRNSAVAGAWTRIDNGINSLEVRKLIRLTDEQWYLQGVNDVAVTSNAGDSWTYLTPVKYDQPSGGRVYSFDVARSDPSHMLGGTNSDIYRSSDAGLTWQGASPQQNEPIGSITIHPTNPLEIVCGGLYNLKRSTDGGVTWKNELENNVRSILAISRNPKAPSHLIAAEESALYGSVDGGLSWTKHVGTLAFVEQIVGDVNEGSTFYASSSTGLKMTTDNGVTWQSPWSYAYGIRAFVQDPRNSDVFVAAPTNGRGQLIRLVRSTGIVDTIFDPGWENENYSITQLMIAGNTIVAGTQTGLLWFDPTPVSVMENDSEGMGLVLAPNPATDHVVVTSQTFGTAPVQIDVLDLQGRVLSTTVVAPAGLGYGHRIDLSHVPTGLLILRYASEKGIYTSCLVHIQ